MVPVEHVHQFTGRLSQIVDQMNQEDRMSVEVKGLAAVVKQAKDAIRTASDSAAQMQQEAKDLTATVAQVEAMKNELHQANAELKAAVGEMGNGGPPLDQPVPTSSPSDPQHPKDVPTATKVVNDANKPGAN